MTIRIIVFFLSLYGLSGCVSRDLITVEYAGKTMGTTYRITASLYSDATPVDQSDVDYTLWDISQSLSTYEEGSLISTINASRDTSETHIVDSHFLAVFRQAKEIYDVTEGAFNPAVGPLVRAWGFGPDDASSLSAEDVAALQQLADFNAFQLEDRNPPVLRKSIPLAELDFSAIAKGYAVDEIGRLFEAQEITNYLVEIGGEVRARGKHADGRAWRIGIEQPLEAARDIQAVMELVDVSMATSGNYRNFYVRDGQKFVHTINPATGYPEQNRLLSATVIAQECMTADAFATALMVMGYERSIDFSSTPGSPDMYLIAGGDSVAFEVFATEGISRAIGSGIGSN